MWRSEPQMPVASTLTTASSGVSGSGSGRSSSATRPGSWNVTARIGWLAALPGGPHQHLVHGDAARGGDRVEDRLRDVVRLERLADLLAHPLDRVDHHRVLVVVLELGRDEARLDHRDLHVRG